MTGHFLALDAGLSGIEFGAFEAFEREPHLVAKGHAEGIGTNAHFVAKSVNI